MQAKGHVGCHLDGLLHGTPAMPLRVAIGHAHLTKEVFGKGIREDDLMHHAVAHDDVSLGHRWDRKPFAVCASYSVPSFRHFQTPLKHIPC